MKLKINKKDIIVFDLDKTIWDCEDKYTNSIWAKQIIFPIIPIDDNTIIDDCGSICRLQDGFKEFLNKINKNKLVYLSNGGLLGTDTQHQPSIKLLKHFDIYNFFSADSILTYKSWPKKNYFFGNYNYIFFDDDDQHLDDLKNKDNVLCVDRKKMNQWNDLKIEK